MIKQIILLLLFPLASFGQVKIAGKIIDSKTKQAIPYANIEEFRTQKGTQSNQNGLFNLDIPLAKSTDTLKISCVGYADQLITQIKDNLNLVYELTPVIFQLNEIVVKRANVIEENIGILNTKGKITQNFSRMQQVPGLQRAVFMNSDGKIGYIKKVHFFIGKELFNAPFRIRIYENLKNLPGKDLLNKSLEFIAYQKNAWNDFDISEYQLSVPENGFWIAVEYIANDNFTALTNPFNRHNKDGTIDKGVRLKYYGPQILEKFDSNYGLTAYKNLGGKWGKIYGIISNGNETIKRKVNIDLLVRSTIQVYE